MANVSRYKIFWWKRWLTVTGKGVHWMFDNNNKIINMCKYKNKNKERKKEREEGRRHSVLYLGIWSRKPLYTIELSLKICHLNAIVYLLLPNNDKEGKKKNSRLYRKDRERRKVDKECGNHNKNTHLQTCVSTFAAIDRRCKTVLNFFLSNSCFLSLWS